MKHSDILETSTESPLSDAELSQVHGGAATAATSTTSTPPASEDPTGKTSDSTSSAPGRRQPKYPGEHIPGQTPPIYPFPTA
ncbi:MAG: hypothetical protein RL033_3060 [Pseudomonadota bacterium]|jgi:hypothetical protein